MVSEIVSLGLGSQLSEKPGLAGTGMALQATLASSGKEVNTGAVVSNTVIVCVNDC